MSWWEVAAGWDTDTVQGSASLHDLSTFDVRPNEPMLRSSRPIGFGADIDQKLRYSIAAPSVSISMKEARRLCART